MAGGKLTPRQKMINMMYLVLTALLAMNVSSEILNAFKTVNNSIMTSNGLIREKNDGVNKAFSDAVADPTQKANAELWRPFSDKATLVSDDMYNYLEKMKTDLKVLSGLKIDEHGDETYKEDDLDAATKLLIEDNNGAKGLELYNKLKKFKEDITKVIDVSVLPEAQKAKYKSELENIEKNHPLNLKVLQSKSSNKYKDTPEDWVKSNFYMTPTVACVTILSKFQNDVRNCEATYKDYCLNQIGKVKVVYDEFQAIASANTNYAMPGDPIEVYAGVGAFSAASKPTVSINGSVIPLVDGMATWKTTASGEGTRSIPVNISFTKPDGSIAKVTKELKYTIGRPTGAAVMLDNMNVVYIGVDNPMTISSGSGDEKTTVAGNGGGLTITKNGGGKYTARATTPTLQAGLKVSVQGGKAFDFPLRVKRIPNPTAAVGGDMERGTGGTVGPGYLKAQSGVVAILQNFDFKCDFKVTSFSMIYSSKGDIFRSQAAGPRFNDQMIGFFGRAKSKDVIIIEDIKAVGCDGASRKLNQIAFTIQ